MKITKNKELEIVTKYLVNETLLKSALKDLDLVALTNIQEIIIKVTNDLKDEFELKQIAEAEREQKRLEMIALIEAQGFSLQELIGSKRKPTKKQHKYVYQVNGKTKYWSGLGRMPFELRTLVEGGRPLESFLIEKQAPSNQSE